MVEWQKSPQLPHVGMGRFLMWKWAYGISHVSTNRGGNGYCYRHSVTLRRSKQLVSDLDNSELIFMGEVIVEFGVSPLPIS
jgi:hypothetical protein